MNKKKKEKKEKKSFIVCCFMKCVFFETAAALSVRLFIRSAQYGRSKDYVFWCLFTIAKLAFGKGLMLPVFCFVVVI